MKITINYKDNTQRLLDNEIEIQECTFNQDVNYLVMNTNTHNSLEEYFSNILSMKYFMCVDNFSQYKQYPIAINEALEDNIIDIV